ncbi:hypothetical protein AVEN_210355-1, partial [Araneus ventricosus]
YGNGQLQVKSLPVEFFNPTEFSEIPSDKLRLKFGVPELFIRNLDVPRLSNGTRFQITHLGPKAVLATDLTGIAKEFFNPTEFSGIPSDKLRLKFGVPELFKRNLDVPRLRNGTRFQITHLGPKVVLATDITGIAKGESAKFYAFR